MSHYPKSMSCHEFQGQLAELIGSGKDVENHPHLRSCDLCTALLRDLKAIADAARDLFDIPAPEPEGIQEPAPKDDLWTRIETEIRKEEAGGQPRSERPV
jgi:hypothetical protein